MSRFFPKKITLLGRRVFCILHVSNVQDIDNLLSIGSFVDGLNPAPFLTFCYQKNRLYHYPNMD